MIDIGSNSGRVVVYGLGPGGHLGILASSRAPLRLVRELDETRSLSRASVERALSALRDFRAVALGSGARRVLAVATAAVRDAANGPRFIERVRRSLGLRVRLLSGQEEARYGFLGAVRGLPVEDGCLFDLGGGSLQVSRFENRRLVGSESFPLGALRLSDAFLDSDPPTNKERRRLREHAGRFFEKARLRRLKRGQALVGTGGTVRNLARIDQRLTGYPIRRLHGYVLSRERAEALVDMIGSRRLRKRSSIPGLNDDRGDSIVGGGLAILTLMDALDASGVIVAGQGVREGLALGLIHGGVPPEERMRKASILDLAEGFRGWDRRSAARRAAIADSLRARLLPRAAPDLCEALSHAATALDVGRSIDYFDRHEHVADIVLATDLLGFSHRGIALLSAILRCAGDARTDLAAYAPLMTKADAAAIEKAAVLLVLADDIEERCPDSRRVSLRFRIAPDAVRINVRGLLGWRPRRIGARFEHAFGRKLVVTPEGV